MNWEVFEREGCGLVKVLFLHFPGGSEETHDGPPVTIVLVSMSRPRFEPTTFQIRVKSVTATRMHSVSGLLEKLIVTELLKKLPQLEPRGSLQCSQEVATGP
jgi:hypothetical protein